MTSTSTNGRAQAKGAEQAMGRNVRQLGSDVLTLAELQADLLQADMRELTRSMTKGAAALVGALVCLLATLPVLLISLGYFLEAWTDWSLAASMLASGAIGLALAVVLGVIGVRWLKRDQPPLQRFRTELRQNVRWLKRILTQPSSASEMADFDRPKL